MRVLLWVLVGVVGLCGNGWAKDLPQSFNHTSSPDTPKKIINHDAQPQATKHDIIGEVFVQKGRVDVKKLEVVLGDQDTPERFVWENQQVLRDWTKKTNAQVCATVCVQFSPQALKKMGMIVTTSGSQLHCPVVKQCPLGMIETPFHVHTHTKDEQIVPNAVDKLYGLHQQTMQEPNMFSEKDLNEKNIFLVGPQIVLFHNGESLVVVKDEIKPEESHQTLDQETSKQETSKQKPAKTTITPPVAVAPTKG